MGAFPAIGDMLSEVATSISRNKLRVTLTGFSVAFGILMLIVLLAAGNGLLNGVMHNFGSQSHNTMTIYGGWTSKEWHGHPKWREIRLEQRDWQILETQYPGVISQSMPTINRSVKVGSGMRSRAATLYGLVPEYLHTSSIIMAHGRWINRLDMQQRRKVAVADAQTLAVLFPSSEPSECIGRWVTIDDLSFQIVGIYKNSDNHSGDQNVYAPFTTLASIYGGSMQNLGSIRLTLHGLKTAEANEGFEQRLRNDMARIKDFDPTDHGVWIRNTAEEYLRTMKMFDGINLLIWIIGLASLVAGVVGISNIMLITVRERTREFGIRKAIGARPRSIVMLVLTESVAITLISGYIGMFIGIGLTQLVASAIEGAAQGNFSIFRNPQVSLGVVTGATAVMVVAGLIAGYVPALRAVRIKPVEALAS